MTIQTADVHLCARCTGCLTACTGGTPVDQIQKQNIFHCQHCNSRHFSTAARSEHILLCHPQGCFGCGWVFKPKADRGVCRKLCRPCGLVFRSGPALMQHLSDAHGRNHCGMCYRAFATKEAVAAHRSAAHGIAEGHKIPRNICEICRRTFVDEEALYQHQRDNGRCGRGPSTRPAGAAPAAKPPQPKFACQGCQGLFGDAEALAQHQRAKNHGSGYKDRVKTLAIETVEKALEFCCLDCDAPVQSDKALLRHLLDTGHRAGAHRHGTRVCIHCDLEFETGRDIIQHMECTHRRPSLVRVWPGSSACDTKPEYSTTVASVKGPRPSPQPSPSKSSTTLTAGPHVAAADTTTTTSAYGILTRTPETLSASRTPLFTDASSVSPAESAQLVVKRTRPLKEVEHDGDKGTKVKTTCYYGDDEEAEEEGASRDSGSEADGGVYLPPYGSLPLR